MFDGKKTFIAQLSLVTLLVSQVSSLAYAQTTGPFSDVGSNHPNVTAIQFMKDSGVFEGYPDGTYQPDRVLNRAEQLKVYMLLHGLDPAASEYKNCFPDVKEEWFARFVCFAKEQKWVQGYPDDTFKPGQEVNTVEALKMLGEIQGWDMTEPATPPYPDVPTGQWYTKYVAFAKNAGLLGTTGNIKPAGGLTRAATAELLFRSLAVYALGETAYSADLVDEILDVDVAQLPPPPSLAGAAPVAEFGDAPESGAAGYAGSFSTVQAAFPTLFNTSNSSMEGAHALDSSMEWLGVSVSDETDADDSSDPDGTMNLDNADGFDDGVKGLNISLVSIPPPATLTVDVTVDESAPAGPRYLNAVIDLNMDGKWKGHAAGGEQEWVVKNYVVNVAPGSTQTVTTDEFAYSNGWLLTPTSWMRVVLSREPLSVSSFGTNGWDGSGEFEYGEVEDYYIQLPNWNDGEGGPGGRAGGGRGLVWGKPAPVMTCPRKVVFPTGIDTVRFMCQVSNFGGPGDVQYDLWPIVAGVMVAPVTGVLNLATAPPGFPPFGVVGNPKFVWLTATKGTTPSTWGYTVVGIDPLSTVKDSVIDLGLVPGDSDEGYEAGDIEDIESWAAQLNDYYLFGGGWDGVLITDATFLVVDDASHDYHFRGVPHVRFPEGQVTDVMYDWSSPSACGLLDWDETTGVVDWTFDSAEADECMEGGIKLTVGDGDNIDDMVFGAAVWMDEAISTPVNEPPVIEGLEAVWTNNAEDDPHMYQLYLTASDPDDDSLTYNWTNVSCGSFNTGTSSSMVGWQYPLASMAACSSAQVTVQVSDGTDTTQKTLSIF